MKSPRETFHKAQEAYRSRRFRPLQKAYAGLIFLKNRKSAQAVKNAIKGNQLAVAGLATAVGAAGIGGYATVNAREAQSGVDRLIEGQADLQQRLASVEMDVKLANVALAETQYQVEVLKDSTTQGMRNLRAKLASMMLRTDDVARNLAALPATPDYQPAIDRAQRLATNAGLAAKKAQEAAQKAREDATDPQARQAAAEAQTTARDAADAARDLQEQIDELPEGYQPYPRHLTFPVINTTINDGARQNVVTADLAEGTYRATYTARAESTAVIYGSFQFWKSGDTLTHQKVSVPAGVTVTLTYEFTWSGGNLSFASWFNDPISGRPEAAITVSSDVTFERLS